MYKYILECKKKERRNMYKPSAPRLSKITKYRRRPATLTYKNFSPKYSYIVINEIPILVFPGRFLNAFPGHSARCVVREALRARARRRVCRCGLQKLRKIKRK